MIIYHGSSSPGDIESASKAAPSHTHGYCWTPYKMTPHDTPYILDNGAFHAYSNNVPWNADDFVQRLCQIETRMPRGPNFVVLPDVVTNPERTKKRSRKWAGIIDYPTAFAVQDGVEPNDAIEFANEVEADYLFVGGTVEWKRRNAASFVDAAHDNGLKCHIGRPGNLLWVKEIGADSADTMSIVAHKDWHKLERLETDRSLASFGMDLPARTDGGTQ